MTMGMEEVGTRCEILFHTLPRHAYSDVLYVEALAVSLSISFWEGGKCREEI